MRNTWKCGELKPYFSPILPEDKKKKKNNTEKERYRAPQEKTHKRQVHADP